MKGDFSLPSLEIQRKLMAILKLLPIRTDHLRETGLGRVIMFYAKCDRVLPEIKKIVAELLDKWMRPIMKRSDDYKDRYVIEKSPSGRKTSTMEEEVEVFGKDDARNHWVQVPVVKNSYEFVPKSSVGISKEAEKGKAGTDRFRKITKKK